MWYGAARDFLKLLNHKGLPVFNPLHGEAVASMVVRKEGKKQTVMIMAIRKEGMEVEEEGILNGIQ